MGCIYHIHGGGYVAGAASQLGGGAPSAGRGARLRHRLGHRLAPETPHPGPLEDCYAGLAWTFAHADRLGIDRDRIGVMGESAGGGLAAALALLARDHIRLAFQHLTYPMLDDRTCTRDPHPHAGEFIWRPESNRFGWTALLGQEPGGADVSPYAGAGARATDLAGLPQTYIATAALDLFVEEDIDYARRLIAAGVPCELHVYPGAFHGFDIFPAAEVARRAGTDRIAALRRQMSSAQPSRPLGSTGVSRGRSAPARRQTSRMVQSPRRSTASSVAPQRANAATTSPRCVPAAPRARSPHCPAPRWRRVRAPSTPGVPRGCWR
ncbi:alpha/beta hydrolase fold domain-containing protein [Sphingomonas sp. MMS24-JH45]